MPPLLDVTDPFPFTLTDSVSLPDVDIVVCAWAGVAVSRSTITFAVYVPAVE
jgi:hypothetical protein